MSILLAVGVIVGACVVTCTLLVAVLRRQGRDALLTDTTRGAGIYGVVGTSFAVLLAFVVLVAFESYNNARSSAETEADALLEEYRAAESFPSAHREQIQDLLYCYGLSVIHLDWDAMADGDRSPVTSAWSFALQAGLRDIPVHREKEAVAFGNVLDLRDERVDARRARLVEG